MERKRHPFAELDDIGFIGDPSYKLTPEDWAIFAQKGEEARQRYHQMLEDERNGIKPYEMTPEEEAVLAQKAEESRQRYWQMLEQERNSAALAHAV